MRRNHSEKKREKLKEEIDKHQIAQNELKKCLLKKCDGLKNELKKKVDENCQKRSDGLAKIELLIDNTVDLQQNLRNSLSMSDGHLIQNFAALQKK